MVLFEESRPEISISISAQIDENGDFLLEGLDSGTLVKELKGDWDYEYNLIIRKADKEMLIKKLSSEDPSVNNDADFMHWLRSNYSHDRAYSQFHRLVQEMKIVHGVFMWP